MSDIIHLLPDSIANQIAAGEVVQRPASVVKELVENSLDAKSTSIQIILKDSGSTLIQIIDNGIGMSATDLRLSFERHATSKITKAQDLFNLKTIGFRGEALPSIASVAQVEVKTKRENDDIGSQLIIHGSKVESQEPVSCNNGTIVSVRNLFFNVPARRKFIKSTETERRHVINEISRIVLVNPNVEFTVIENNIKTMYFPKSTLKMRIVDFEGKNVNKQLIEISTETSIVKIDGYISQPKYARKSRVSQYFFVNGRYIYHPYFNRAIKKAYEPLIVSDCNAPYFIYFQVDPASIDVNIHPTKTEVKFENEQSIWQILFVTIKESLGKFNAVPSIDFNTEGSIEIPSIKLSESLMSSPKVNINSNYNPFCSLNQKKDSYNSSVINWDQFYKYKNSANDTKPGEIESVDLFPDEIKVSSPEHYQYKQKYILTSVKSGLMIIDQRAAHIRVLFDKYIKLIKSRKGVSQRLLFPKMVELSPIQSNTLSYIMDDISSLGFDISDMGNNSFAIQGVPSDIISSNIDFSQIILSIITNKIETASDVKEDIQTLIALSLAKIFAINYGQNLSSEEMLLLVNNLFSSDSSNYTPDGQLIISVLSDDDIGKMFK